MQPQGKFARYTSSFKAALLSCLHPSATPAALAADDDPSNLKADIDDRLMTPTRPVATRLTSLHHCITTGVVTWIRSTCENFCLRCYRLNAAFCYMSRPTGGEKQKGGEIWIDFVRDKTNDACYRTANRPFRVICLWRKR